MKVENIREDALGTIIVIGVAWVGFVLVAVTGICYWFAPRHYTKTVWVPETFHLVGLNIAGRFECPYVPPPSGSHRIPFEDYAQIYPNKEQFVFIHQNEYGVDPYSEIRYMAIRQDDGYDYTVVSYSRNADDLRSIFQKRTDTLAHKSDWVSLSITEPRDWKATIFGSVASILCLMLLAGSLILFVVKKSESKIMAAS